MTILLFLTLSVGYLRGQTPATEIPKAVGSPTQKITKIDGNQLYRFRTTISNEYNIMKKVSDGQSTRIGKDHLIKREYNIGDTVFLTYIPFNAERSAENAATYNEQLFRIDDENLFYSLADSVVIYKRYKGVSVGVYTVPFRLRFAKGGKFDYESSLSLSSNMIFGFGTNKSARSTLDFSVGVGLTGANLDSLNSDVLDNRTAMAFTLNAGAIWKPTNYANIGLFLGADFLGNRDRSVNWIYNRRPWIGLGINISFNQIQGGNSTTNTPEQPD